MSTFSIQAALLGLPEDLGTSVAHRLNALSSRLWSSQHLEVRDDSRLVWAYALGTLPPEWTEQKVCDELCLMQYIHGYTMYSQQHKATIPVVKQNIEQHVFKDLPQASFHAFQYVQKFVIPVYRIRAMLDQHPDHKFPTRWPWIPAPFEPETEEEEEEEEEDGAPDVDAAQEEEEHPEARDTEPADAASEEEQHEEQEPDATSEEEDDEQEAEDDEGEEEEEEEAAEEDDDGQAEESDDANENTCEEEEGDEDSDDLDDNRVRRMIYGLIEEFIRGSPAPHEDAYESQ